MNFKKTLSTLFGSKKFLMTLTGVLVWVVSRAGLNISPAAVEPVLMLIGMYVGAQGVAEAKRWV